jgi:tRNA threonylcarbamoyladenosine biosynthesis protein TsaB
MYLPNMQNKKDCTISIDTSGARITKVMVMDGDGLERGSCVREGKSQTILPAIEQVVSEKQITLDDVIAITVHTGPGSFTGVRVGVAVAKMMGLLLGVDINGRKSWETTDILYEKDAFSRNPPQG